MKNVRVYRITDYYSDYGSAKVYNFTGLSEADAQELYLAFLEGQLEDDIMEAQRREYLGLEKKTRDYWCEDYNFAEILYMVLDGGCFSYRWYDAIEF